MRNRSSALFLAVILAFFLLLVSGISFAYFYLLPRFEESVLYGEIDIGGEQAGVNFGYPVSRPLTFYLILKYPRTNVSEVRVSLLIDDSPFTSLTCPERKLLTPPAASMVLCPVTVNIAELPLGRHVLRVIIDKIVLLSPSGTRELSNYTIMTVEYYKTETQFYIYQVKQSPLPLGRLA
ncbi:MAG: hypothetical protein QXP38_00035 [Nitrososphaerota archaeon]